MRSVITPETIAIVLKNANKMHKVGHDMNLSHNLIGQCKIGAIFIDQEGFYCVYTGVIADRRTKRPIAFTRVDSRETRCCSLTSNTMDKILAASKENA